MALQKLLREKVLHAGIRARLQSAPVILRVTISLPNSTQSSGVMLFLWQGAINNNQLRAEDAWSSCAILNGLPESTAPANQSIGRAIMFEFGFVAALQLWDDGLSQFLAELNSPLVKRINVPYHPLRVD